MLPYRSVSGISQMGKSWHWKVQWRKESFFLYVLYNKELEGRIITCSRFYLKMVGKTNSQKGGNRNEASLSDSSYLK